MPIHDQSYRHWDGELKSHSLRWSVVTFEGLKIILRRKLFLIFILAPSIIQFLVFGGMIYGVNTYGFFLNTNLITPEFFYKFCTRQTFFIVLICGFAGSGLIANDLKSNALQLYLSKPLTRLDYIVGKVAIILIMLSFITFIPGILLFLEHSVLSQDSAFFLEQYWIIGSIFLYSLILSIPITFLTLALSSITKNNRFAAIILITIVFGTTVLNGMLWVIFRARWTHFTSYWNNIEMLGRGLFGISKSSTDWHYATPIILILTLVCVWIMYRKIKGIEIVT